MDTSGRPSTVRLKPSQAVHYNEARAAGAITPGHLIKHDANNKVVVHATAGGAAEKLFATEDVNILRGKTIDDAFATNDLVSYIPADNGDEIYAWLKGAQNVAAGDLLASAGDGTLQAVGAGVAIAVANEALNLTALPAARIRIRVM